jgi:hypothetical protein
MRLPPLPIWVEKVTTLAVIAASRPIVRTGYSPARSLSAWVRLMSSSRKMLCTRMHEAGQRLFRHAAPRYSRGVFPRTLALVLLLLLATSVGASQAQEPPADVLIYLDNLPEPLRMAPADADAFQRRLNRPSLVPPPLPAAGPWVGIDTPYWDAALRESPDDPQASLGGAYYPQLGLVQTTRENRDAWLLLDQRQRAILDRYIRLGRAGAIGTRPSALQVLAAAAEDETLSVELAGRLLTEAEARSFWERLRTVETRPSFAGGRPHREGGYWLVITLPEGRALSYHYDPAAGSLTDSLGTESHDVSALGLPHTPPAEPPSIRHGSRPGSLLWWPVMLGGGLGLLALAVWTRGRIPA